MTGSNRPIRPTFSARLHRLRIGCHSSRCHSSPCHASRGAGFTLLELLVAFAILALFVLPMLEIVHDARIRAVRYSVKREVQELAQQVLLERVYTYDDKSFEAGAMAPIVGTFEEFGRPDWEYQIDPPEMLNDGQQLLLEYTIHVNAPQLKAVNMNAGIGGGEGAGMEDLGTFDSMFGRTPPFDPETSYKMSTWALPSEAFYEERDYLREQGLLDDPMFYGSGYGGYDTSGFDFSGMFPGM